MERNDGETFYCVKLFDFDKETVGLLLNVLWAIEAVNNDCYYSNAISRSILYLFNLNILNLDINQFLF